MTQWTEEDVAELVIMWHNRSELRAIADERACIEKHRSIQNGQTD